MFKAMALAATLALAPAASVYAQPSASPDPLLDSYFQELRKGQVALAYRNLWGGTLMERKPADVDFVIRQTEVALQSFGKVADWELVSETAYAPSYRTRIYLVRLEQGPLFFRVKLYRRPSLGWMVYGLDFRDSYDALAPSPSSAQPPPR